MSTTGGRSASAENGTPIGDGWSHAPAGLGWKIYSSCLPSTLPTVTQRGHHRPYSLIVWPWLNFGRNPRP